MGNIPDKSNKTGQDIIFDKQQRKGKSQERNRNRKNFGNSSSDQNKETNSPIEITQPYNPYQMREQYYCESQDIPKDDKAYSNTDKLHQSNQNSTDKKILTEKRN